MPTRNIVKQYGAGEYYHVYNRGVDKQRIFHDADDYAYFLSLFKRHLSREPSHDNRGREYPHYADSVELVAYCLMPNHYHLLLYLKEVDGIEKLMRSVMTAYSGFFNRRHNRVGTLFQNHFLASRITSDAYLWHVSRYIHLNSLDIREDPTTYAYSSVVYYQGERSAEWLHPEHLVESTGEMTRYVQDLVDDQDYHELRHRLQHELANETE